MGCDGGQESLGDTGLLALRMEASSGAREPKEGRSSRQKGRASSLPQSLQKTVLRHHDYLREAGGHESQDCKTTELTLSRMGRWQLAAAVRRGYFDACGQSDPFHLCFLPPSPNQEF